MARICESISVSDGRLYDEKSNITSLESKVNKRVAEIDSLKANIRRETLTVENMLQELIEDGVLNDDGQNESVPKGKVAQLISEQDRIKAILLENINHISELHRQRSEATNDRNRIQQQRDRIANNLNNLDDSRHQKLQQFNSSRDRDTYEAVRWLQANKMKFKQAVFEPVALEINVADKKYFKKYLTVVWPE